VKHWLALLMALALVSPASAEEAIVADGVTISSYIDSNFGGTNVEHSTDLTNAFTTNGTSTVTVAHTSHGKSVGNTFSIEDGPTVDGLNMNEGWTIATVPNANSYTFTHTGTASGSTSNSGSARVTFGAANNDGKMRFFCFISHHGYDDPIKNQGTRGAAHLHAFYGNTLTDHNSTYQTLRASGEGTCDGGPLNRSAYWYPALINGATNKVKVPLVAEWYYVNGARQLLVDRESGKCSTTGLLQDGRPVACPQLAIRRLRRGQKIIFGYDPSGASNGGTPGFPSSYTSSGPALSGTKMLDSAFKCTTTGDVVQGSSYRYLHHRSNSSLGLTSNGSCPATGKVQIVVTAPNCWDGELDNANHYGHFTQASSDGISGTWCPATHPYSHMTFTTILYFNYTGGISTVEDWYLASDRHNGADFEAGETFHWDMLFGWSDTVLDHWSKHILGMYPDPDSPSTYIYNDFGGGGVGASTVAGGAHMRNTNNGGLGIYPCDDLGLGATCRLKQHSTFGIGLTDTEVDIPENPGNPGKSKMH
jgi:hypothetical protein